MHEHGLPNPVMQEEFLLVSFFDKFTVDMTSCFDVKEEIDEEHDREESSLWEADKTLFTLETLPMHRKKQGVHFL